MAMAARMRMNMGQRPMTTDVLTLTQLLSPSFPVGAFAYSHGLEMAIAEGQIWDAATLEGWLRDLLEHGGGLADAVLLNAAFGATDVGAIDATARAFASGRERLMETDLQGAAFCETVNAIHALDLYGLCYPVAVGRTARLLKLDVTLTTALYLHAFAANLTAAAMRALPLGQVDGQRVQIALKPLCTCIAQDTQNATLADLHSTAWLSDIAAMRHETLYSRTFRS